MGGVGEKTQTASRVEQGMLKNVAMTVKLVSSTGGRGVRLTSKAFGKVLHLAKMHGWSPGTLRGDPHSQACETAVILPHIGQFTPGAVSSAEAEGLRRAITRALAVGDVASDGTAQFASEVLLQLSRGGSFQVRFELETLSRETETLAGSR